MPGVAFSTRLGGVSPAPYDSLNLSPATGDDPERVAANRLRLSGALGLPADYFPDLFAGAGRPALRLARRLPLHVCFGCTNGECGQLFRRVDPMPRIRGLMVAASLVTTSLAVSPVGRAQDWPMYRGGPELRGIAGGSLPDKPVLLWRFKTSGPVKSSAAVVNNRVFIGSSDGNVYALKLADGHKLWSFKTGGDVESSPLVLQEKVFTGASDGFLYALDAASGALKWKYETGDKIVGAPNWDKKGTRTSVLVGSYDFKLHCIDTATGKSNWVYETANYINGSPAVANGQAVFGGCDGLLHVIEVTDGHQIREVPAGAYVPGSVALANGKAFFGQYDNRFLCIDLQAGKIDWEFKDRNFPYIASPAVSEDRVVFGGEDKLLHCVKRVDGSSLWSFATRGKVDASPVICRDRVVAGSDDGHLYIVLLESGQEVWSYEIGQAINSSPAVAQGRLIVGSDDGVVYCFGAK